MKIKALIGILIVIGLIVVVSGCTSQTVDPAKDIVQENKFSIYPNGPNKWYTTAYVKSQNNQAYKKVTFLITAYDSQNKTIAQNTTWVHNFIKGSHPMVYTTLTSKTKPDHVDIKVLNATFA